ncbi:MAG TPA: phytanoyl-CoA dioxygenase family protein [Candidatus Sulfotelmatobacter sp.]|nr:phytanoyl-CoA dioxygenase family protein [Candidatus Sulfotelmatobacter sp.]
MTAEPAPRDAAYLDDYRRRGVAVVRGVFAPAEIAALAAAFDRIHAEAIAHPRSWRHGNRLIRLGTDPALGKIVRLVQWPSYADPVLDGFRLDRRMFDLVAPLIGRDIKQIINQMHWKPPGAAAAEFAYHQDIRFRRPRGAYREPRTAYVQTGIAIDAHRLDNGAMMVCPESHRLDELALGHAGPILDSAMAADDLVRVGLDPTRAEPLLLEPGDVALWNLFTVHGSGPNRSATDRRFYINGYVAAAQCDRGEWTFRDGQPCRLGAPVLVHYEDLHRRPDPHYLDE